MRKTNFIPAIFATIAIIAVAAPAARAYEGDVNTTVTAVFWAGKLDFGGENTTIRPLPALTAQIEFNDALKANLEYSKAPSSSTEPSGLVFENRIMLAGMQYAVAQDFFVTASYQRIDYNLSGALLPNSINFNGFRLGGGYYFTKWLADDWTGYVDFGVGLTNNADVESTNGTAKQDADVIDGKIEARYNFAENLSAVGGYKYLKTRTNVALVPYSFDVKGPFLGIGYDF